MRKLRWIFMAIATQRDMRLYQISIAKISVIKCDWKGQIQKRVDAMLKTKQKGLNRWRKFNDVFIDKLPKFYGRAIRSNFNHVQGMQCRNFSVYQWFPRAKQVPSRTWELVQVPKAVPNGTNYNDECKGLSLHATNVVKPLYLKLCKQKLISECLRDNTQNAIESFNGIL